MIPQIKAAALAACAVLLGAVVVVGQAPKTQPPPDAERASSVQTGKSDARVCVGCELPITLKESVVAGKTTVGTKVDAQLIMATMIQGGVIPRGAVISGDVVESVAKSGDSPSQLAIRMDSARWKSGEAKFKMYLTAWYYPPAPMAPADLSYAPPGGNRNWGGVDYSDPPSPMSQRKWSSQHDEDNGMNASAPASIVSTKRVLMKNVESTPGTDGSVVLVSSRSSIKLNKVTAYVLAVGELLPGK
jgi:hypothetical protein